MRYGMIWEIGSLKRMNHAYFNCKSLFLLYLRALNLLAHILLDWNHYDMNTSIISPSQVVLVVRLMFLIRIFGKKGLFNFLLVSMKLFHLFRLKSCSWRLCPHLTRCSTLFFKRNSNGRSPFSPPLDLRTMFSLLRPILDLSSLLPNEKSPSANTVVLLALLSRNASSCMVILSILSLSWSLSIWHIRSVWCYYLGYISYFINWVSISATFGITPIISFSLHWSIALLCQFRYFYILFTNWYSFYFSYSIYFFILKFTPISY